VTSEAGIMHVRIGGADPGEALRSAAVNAEVSRVAAMPQVRAFVNGLLRAGAALGGVVMDGRDIGTVVFPDAEVKIFMIADAEVRAKRRLAERGHDVDEHTVRRETGTLRDRDARDSSRIVAPLVPAPDAVHLDTTRLGFDEQVRMVVQLARKARRD
jgi:cytidylate kinase